MVTKICESKFGNTLRTGNATVGAFRVDARFAVRVVLPGGMDIDCPDVFRFDSEVDAMTMFIAQCARVRKLIGDYVPACIFPAHGTANRGLPSSR